MKNIKHYKWKKLYRKTFVDFLKSTAIEPAFIASRKENG